MTPKIPAELRELRDLFHVCDPAPKHVIAAAYTAPRRIRPYGRTAELELVGDSAEAPVTTGVRAGRGRPEPRVLTFMTPGRIIELDLTPTVPRMFRASGMVISRAGQGVPTGEMVLRHPEGECVGDLDEHGGFVVDDVPSGPLSVVFHSSRSAPAVADWLVC